MKRTVGWALSMTLGLSVLLSACGSSGAKTESTKTGGEAAAAAGPVQMTFFAPQGKANWEDNDFTKLVQNKFNVKINWSVAPNDALKDRRQLLLASGDYPEVFLEGKFSYTDLLKYGQEGVFLPLNKLIDKYAPNIKKTMEDKPYFKTAITAPDGNIYALPRLNECYHCTYPQKMWINKEWLDKLGLKMPTTTDEMYEVLKAFKEKDPNGNGKKDEIPLTGGPDKNVWAGNMDAFFMNAFIYNDNNKYLLLNNGKVDFAANKPEWKQGLTYMHKLYKDGLVDPASFTQNDQALGQLGKKDGDEVVGSVTTALLSYLVDTYSDDNARQKHWVIVPPLKGPNGVQLAGVSQGISEFEFAITNKAKEEQQIAAIKIIDYMFSEEGALLSEYGTEGQGWLKAKEGEKNTEGKPAKYTFEGLKAEDPNKVRNDSWSLMGAKNMSKEFRDLFATNQNPISGKGYELRLAQATKQYEPFAPKEVYPTGVFIRPEDTDAAAQLTTAIKDYVTSNMAQFITGSKDIDKDWDSYVKGFDGLNLKQYIDIYQRALDKK